MSPCPRPPSREPWLPTAGAQLPIGGPGLPTPNTAVLGTRTGHLGHPPAQLRRHNLKSKGFDVQVELFSFHQGVCASDIFLGPSENPPRGRLRVWGERGIPDPWGQHRLPGASLGSTSPSFSRTEPRALRGPGPSAGLVPGVIRDGETALGWRQQAARSCSGP